MTTATPTRTIMEVDARFFEGAKKIVVWQRRGREPFTGTDPGGTATVNCANPQLPSSSSAYRF